MNHQQALSTGAAERYLLEEMTAEERDQFEEHFFSCPECGSDMHSASLLIDGIRAQGLETSKVVQFAPRKPLAARIPLWMPSTIAAALALVVCYQSLIVIPGMRREPGTTEARQVAMYLLRPETRGDVRKLVRQPGQSVVLTLDIPVAPASEDVEGIIQDGSGRTVTRVPLTLPTGETRIAVELPAALPPSQYTVILNSAASEIGRYQFDLGERPKGS